MSIVSGVTDTTSTTNTTSSTSLGKDDFLTLLVTQLQNQDPLNPQADTEFIAQLAQFSQLEQLTNISSDVSSIAGDASGTMLGAMNYIGKSIMSEGNAITVSDGSASSVYLSIGSATASTYVNVYDTDGTLVRSENLGAKSAGSVTYTWDGKNTDGQTVADGTYYIKTVGEDANGSSVNIGTEVAGTVTGVVNDSSGIYLIMNDGTYVNFTDVTQVVQSSTTSGS